jgi:hypothetical protein
VVALGFVVLALRPADPAGWAFCAVFVAFSTGLAVSQARVRVEGSPDGRLLVRNRLRTRVLNRSQVTEVLTSQGAGRGAPHAVELVLHDRSGLRLDVTEGPPLLGATRRVRAQADLLRAWVDGRPAPFLGG